MRSATSFLLFSVFTSLLVRYLISRWPYSGQARPPMYGDYEAQRHWMEITVNLPVDQWYINSTRNNLTYWGLDYPPLTAYHMYLNGRVAKLINPSWVQLNTSAGTEGYGHKLFMRGTVLVSDLVTFYPALLLLYCFGERRLSVDPAAIVLNLFLPALIITDHGHFQYNCVSLGLCLLAIFFLQSNRLIACTVAFCLALNYKQISLYYAMPFFVFMLGKISSTPGILRKVRLFTLLGIAVVATFSLCWLPFIKDASLMSAVFKRIFPVDRGLFEDKVANIWCPLETIFKLRSKMSKEALFKLSSITTLLAIVPSSIHLFFNPSLKNFKCSLTISGLAFFLLSFQVHEKGILFASLAGSLLVKRDHLLSGWLSIVSSLSLMPLMIKDGLVIPMLAVTLLYACIFLSLYSSKLISTLDEETLAAKLAALALNTSIFGHAILMSLFVLKPPKRYPDLFTVIYSTWSASHFIMFFLMIHLLQFYDQENNALMKSCEIVETLIRRLVPRAKASVNGASPASKKNK